MSLTLAERIYRRYDNWENALDDRLIEFHRQDPMGYEKRLQLGWAIAGGVVAASAEVVAHKMDNSSSTKDLAVKGLHLLAAGAAGFVLARAESYGEIVGSEK